MSACNDPTVSVNWREILFVPDFMGRLENYAKKRFGDNSLAEEACTFSLDRLLDPQWQAKRLNQYGGKASPEGFLFSVFRMLLEDFSRQRFGRPRPPSWLKRLGPFWEKIFNLLCLERLEPEGIHSRLQSGNDRELHEYIEDAVSVIRSRVTNCGEQIGETLHDFQESEIGHANPEHGGASEYEEKHTRETITALLTSLAAVLSRAGEEQNTTRYDSATAQALAADAADRAARFRLRLNDGDTLLLRMIYQEGRKISEVARILDEPEHTLRRRLKQSMDTLRQQLEDQGLGLDLLKSMLD